MALPLAGIKIGFDPVNYPNNFEDIGVVTLLIRQFDRAPGIDRDIAVIFDTIDGPALGKYYKICLLFIVKQFSFACQGIKIN